jgi:hypothetical protein
MEPGSIASRIEHGKANWFASVAARYRIGGSGDMMHRSFSGAIG